MKGRIRDSMQDNSGIIWYPPLIYAVPLIVGLLLHWAVPFPFLQSPLQLFMGLPLVGMGLFVSSWARRIMNPAGTDQSISTNNGNCG